MKRALDIVGASLLLALTSPVLLVIGAAIRIGSPGPIIYRQTRVGRYGRHFTLYKFRSMYTGADTARHEQHMRSIIRHAELAPHPNTSLKLALDPRIVPIGRLLRRTSLDELPQLVNVLRGEMSLVGPRPALPYEVELYQEWQKRRLDAAPGITGWWQVRGRNSVSFAENVRMDLYYLEHQSIWLDLQILAKTPIAMIRGAGAG